MKEVLFYRAGDSRAVQYAQRKLEAEGLRFSSTLTDRVSHILFNIPTKDANIDIPTYPVVIGGNLQGFFPNNLHLDLLRDERYLSANAALTAHGAIKVAMEQLPCALAGCDTLIIGWGRIGKCLAFLLKALGAQVTVAARREESRAMAESLGFRAIEMGNICGRDWHLLYNTVPYPVVSKEQADQLPGNCLMIDLASKKGIDCDRVVWARGLPGKEIPESSGDLIARTVLRHLKNEEGKV